MPKSWSAKYVNLEFDGVFQVAEIFVKANALVNIKAVIPVKFHEHCGQTQAGIWKPPIDFIRIIYLLRYLGLPWTNDEGGLDTDVDKLRLRSVHGLGTD